MASNQTTPVAAAGEQPRYETPTIKQMSEREILKTFQITQSMSGWWTTAAC